MLPTGHVQARDTSLGPTAPPGRREHHLEPASPSGATGRELTAGARVPGPPCPGAEIASAC